MIELPPGRPCLSADELNRLIRQQSLGHQIAQAMIVDQIVQSVQLDEQESGRLVDSYLADRGISDGRSAPTDIPRQQYIGMVAAADVLHGPFVYVPLNGLTCT